MNRLAPRLYADLIGRPFAQGARGPDAFDCLGLVLELQRRQGRTLPEFHSTMEEYQRQRFAGAGLLGPCVEIAKPVPGCIVVLEVAAAGAWPGMTAHLGTMLNAYSMIHAMPNLAVCCENLLSPFWKRKVRGYYLPDGAA